LNGLEDSSYSSLANAAVDSTSNLELSIASLSLRRTLMDIELTKLELSPTVTLIGDVGLLTSGDNLRLPYDSRAGLFGFSAGVLLEVPLFTWGANDLRVQQREVEAEKSGLQTALLQRSITTESKKIQLQLNNLRERLQSLQTNLKSAEENFFLTKSKYLGGGTLSLEVLSAQQLLTETKLLELQTMADIQVSVVKLEQLYAPNK
jgi:outer membrane protein TolC